MSRDFSFTSLQYNVTVRFIAVVVVVVVVITLPAIATSHTHIKARNIGKKLPPAIVQSENQRQEGTGSTSDRDVDYAQYSRRIERLMTHKATNNTYLRGRNKTVISINMRTLMHSHMEPMKIHKNSIDYSLKSLTTSDVVGSMLDATLHHQVQNEQNHQTPTYKTSNGTHQLPYLTTEETDGYYSYIPFQFIDDVAHYDTSANPLLRPFPRWNNIIGNSFDYTVTTDDEKTNNNITTTIHNNIIENIQHFLLSNLPMYGNPEQDVKSLYRALNHLQDIIWWLPETFYVLQGDKENDKMSLSYKGGIYVSSRMKYMHKSTFQVVEQKIIPTEDLMNRAYQILRKDYYHTQNMKSAAESATQSDTSTTRRWSELQRILFEKNTKSDTYNTIPFFMWYGDYTGCNENNYDRRNTHQSDTSSRTINNTFGRNLLLFTVAGNIHCNYTVPFPNYQIYNDAKNKAEEWMNELQHIEAEQQQQQQPLLARQEEEGYVYGIGSLSSSTRSTTTQQARQSLAESYAMKIKQIVWRGSLTGVLPEFNESARSTRYQLLKYIHASSTGSNTTNNTFLSRLPRLTPEESLLFDVKMTYIPVYHFHDLDRVTEYINVTELGAKVATTMEQHQQANLMSKADFNRYRGILDVDGNSWSSRFGQLMCYNSVLLKIEPTYVDYYYYKRRDDQPDTLILRPWEHYIPVRADLSDLLSKTKYVLDDTNLPNLQRIIRNANTWCHTYMIKDAIARDVLDTWTAYVKILNENNPQWEEEWSNFQRTYLPDYLPENSKSGTTSTTTGPLNMTKITLDYS